MDSKRAESREMQAQTPPAGPTLCSNNCGFYAHSAFNGMCSKCYKDQTTLNLNSPTSSTPTTSLMLENTSNPSDAVRASSGVSSASSDIQTEHDVSIAASVKHSTAAFCHSPEDATEAITGALAAISLQDLSSVKEKPKKKRCDTCRKRVGLTGFDCRCGGHYCSLHRYSDTHNCSFDYRTLAQSEIRRHNPVVAAEKIAKI